MAPPRVGGTTDATIPQSSPTEHIVQGRETLSSIAAKYGVTLDAMIAANPQFKAGSAGGEHNRTRGERGTWDADHILVGEKLTLPPGARLAGAPDVTPEVAPETAEPVVTPAVVQDGVDEATPHPASVITAEETATGVRPLPPEETATGPKTQGPEETQSADAKKGSVWGFLTKLFSNPIFQGALAILSAIPGIGQVVSGIGAVIALTLFINSIVQARDGPGDYNWVALGSALLFITGTFIPGAGAFGGLLGMAVGPPPEPKQDDASDGPTQQTAQSTPAPVVDAATFPVMEEETYRANLTAARNQPLLNGDADGTLDWFNSIGMLDGERKRLTAVVGQGQELSAAEAGRLTELNTFFETELAQTTVARQLQLAYGIAQREAEATPTGGKPFIFPEGGDLNAIATGLATTYGDEIDANETLAAIYAYNGVAEGAVPPAGVWMYLPTAEQVDRFLANGLPVTSEVLPGELMRTLKEDLGQLALYLSQFNSEQAQEAVRLNTIIQGMRPGIGTLDSRSQSASGVDEQPPAG